MGVVNQRILGIGQSGQEYLLNTAAMNMFNNGIVNSAKAAGLDPSAIAYGTALAQMQQRNQMTISSSLARKYMPIVKGILTVIVYASFPLIAILMFTPFGFAYVKMVLTLMLWLLLWNPLFCVLNIIINSKAQEQMSSLVCNTSPCTGYGYTLTTQSMVTGYAQDTIAWVGYFAWLVPTMAFMMAKASEYAFVNLASELKGSATAGAGAGASQVATGNVSFGNVSHSGYNANKYNATNEMRMGRDVSAVSRDLYSEASVSQGMVDVKKAGFVNSSLPGDSSVAFKLSNVHTKNPGDGSTTHTIYNSDSPLQKVVASEKGGKVDFTDATMVNTGIDLVSKTEEGYKKGGTRTKTHVDQAKESLDVKRDDSVGMDATRGGGASKEKSHSKDSAYTESVTDDARTVRSESADHSVSTNETSNKTKSTGTATTFAPIETVKGAVKLATPAGRAASAVEGVAGAAGGAGGEASDGAIITNSGQTVASQQGAPAQGAPAVAGKSASGSGGGGSSE
jgi:hypothetical protein